MSLSASIAPRRRLNRRAPGLQRSELFQIFLLNTSWIKSSSIRKVWRAAGAWYSAMPFIIVSSSAKECSRPPKSSICQLAPTPSISASSASRSAFGATGSFEPWMTNTAALMSPFLAGMVVCRSPCSETTALTSAPLRASSSTLPPPKQKPTAAFLLGSPMPRFSASLTNVASAALTRLRPSTRSARTAIIHSCEVGGPAQVLPSPYMQPTKATYLSPSVHAADEGDIFVARHLLRPPDGVLGDAEPVRHHEQQRTFAAHLLIPYQRAFSGHAAGLI